MENPDLLVRVNLAFQLPSVADIAAVCRTDRAWARTCRDSRFWVAVWEDASRRGQTEKAAEVLAVVAANSNLKQAYLRVRDQGIRDMYAHPDMLYGLWERGLPRTSPLLADFLRVLPPNTAVAFIADAYDPTVRVAEMFGVPTANGVEHTVQLAPQAPVLRVDHRFTAWVHVTDARGAHHDLHGEGRFNKAVLYGQPSFVLAEVFGYAGGVTWVGPHRLGIWIEDPLHTRSMETQSHGTWARIGRVNPARRAKRERPQGEGSSRQIPRARLWGDPMEEDADE